MADNDLLRQIKASRLAKRSAMGVKQPYEYPPEKASRVSDGVPYYRQVTERPPDLSGPQKLGDERNLRGPGYADDTRNPLGRWTDAHGGDSGVGNVAGERKPNNRDKNLGSGFVGSEHQASHAFGKPSRRITDSPANAGPGARQGGTPETSGQSPPGSKPITARRVRGRQP